MVVKKINDRLDAIIDDLASTGKFVPDHVVKNFKDGLIWDARRARYNFSDRDIVVMEKFSKTHGRIAELIKMFCWMSPITTLYELEKALVSTERVTTFAELRIGPLLKHPAVAKFFQPPPDLREIPEITAHAIQKMLMKFLDKTRRVAGRGEKHSVQDFLDFFAKALSKPSPLHLCVRITSFPLAIQVYSAVFPPGLKRKGGDWAPSSCLCLGTHIASLYYYPVLCEHGKKRVLIPPFPLWGKHCSVVCH